MAKQIAAPVAEGFMTAEGKLVNTSHSIGYLRVCEEDQAKGCKIVPLYLAGDVVPQPSEEEIEAVESAFDYVFHFAADEKDGHIAQRICDNLQSLEKKLRNEEAA